ncbi:MAG: response regulator [Calditrichaceae bacterium]|nr:response regulator [Calditrichaceae bacterium]
MKVLIVDDKKDNRYFLETLLKGNGYEISSAENGRQALELLDNDTYDLVISDILMPVMDGFELCRRIKENEKLNRIPFIFYTATYTEKRDIELGMSLGASKFLIKPQEPDVILKIIKDTISDAQSEKIETGKVNMDNNNEIFKLYNERLVIKLEKKMLELEKEVQSRQKIENEVRMLAHAIQSISECVSVTNMDGNILFVNDSFIKIYGYSKDDLIGKSVDIIQSANNPQELLETINKQTLNGGWKGEFIHKKKDGAEIPVSLSTSLMRDENNQKMAIISVSSDISDRRELEEQFRQTQKMEAIGRLAGGVAHDFNNLLTVINGYSELILRNMKGDDPIYRQLVEIDKAGQRAASLTRQLLAFSRKQVLQPVVLDIKNIMTNLDKMLHRLLSENIELTTLFDPELGYIKADPGQIEQVILNLVINARDAMPLGGKLTIEIRNIIFEELFYWEDQKIEPGTYLMLSISDTGEGMDQKTVAQIFEPFFTTKKEEGTGLGLSTVYGIVKQSGGFINVYSEISEGSVFKIYFPCVKEPAADLSKKIRNSDSLSGSETILVAEDEEYVRNLACEVLRIHGYTVLDAANGGSALLKCEKHKDTIHLLISDVVMPEMSGIELVERLLSIHHEMKVLYMSGYTDDAVIRHGILEEKVQFLQKPFTPISLLEKVRKILDAK